MKKRIARESIGAARTGDGVSIAYTHYDVGSSRLILLAPGFWRRRRDRENVFVALHLSRCGWDVVSFDFRGHGDSTGLYTFGREEWRDPLAVADRFFPTHRDLAAIGFSMGGSIAADALTRGTRIPARALVMVSSPADLTRLRPRPWRPAAWRMVGFRRAISPPRVDWKTVSREKPRAEDAVESLAIPKLFVTFENDWLVDPSHGDRLFRSAAPPFERAHLNVGNSLHADAAVRVAPKAFLTVITRFLRDVFPPDAVRESIADAG